MNSHKKKKPARWKKVLQKELKRAVKERGKTARAKEKLHRKAVKQRKKKVEKGLDRILVGGCFLVCLAAALLDARDRRKG